MYFDTYFHYIYVSMYEHLILDPRIYGSSFVLLWDAQNKSDLTVIPLQ